MTRAMGSFVVNARFLSNRMTGVQRSAYEISRRLVAEGGDAYRLVAPSTVEESAPLPVERRGRIRQGHFWEQVELPRFVRESGSDAVLYSPATSGPLAVRRQVMTAHDLFPVEHPEWFSRAFSAWYRFLMPGLLRSSAFVLANSEYTRQRVLDRYRLPEEKVVLCHFAQDERFTRAPEEEVEEFREEHGLPERYLLVLGSIEPRKNLATLADAWRRSAARKDGVEMLVSGAGARKAVFNASKSGAESLDDPSITLLGFFPDEQLPLLYQAAEAFALPALAEGFGLPILEAMASGTPVICSDTTAMPEISGGAAMLVPPLDPEAWTEAVDTVLSKPELRAAMRSDGLARAGEFSWSRTVGIVRATLRAV